MVENGELRIRNSLDDGYVVHEEIGCWMLLLCTERSEGLPLQPHGEKMKPAGRMIAHVAACIYTRVAGSTVLDEELNQKDSKVLQFFIYAQCSIRILIIWLADIDTHRHTDTQTH